MTYPCPCCHATEETAPLACICSGDICDACARCAIHCELPCPGAQEAIDQWDEDNRNYWASIGEVTK